MKQYFKKIFTSWKVLLLLFFLILSAVAIQPQLFGTEGVTIRSIGSNSSAANGGMLSPPGKYSPLERERVIAINGDEVSSTENYLTLVKGILPGSSVSVKTNQRTYTLVAPNGTDLGIKVSDAPSSNLRKGLDLEGGTRVLLKPQEEVSKEILEVTIDNLKERLNVYGLSDVLVQSASDLSGADFILIEMAGVTEDEVRELLAKQGKFEAKIGNETVFNGGKKDITYVCRSADCSGIDPRQGCYDSADGKGCSFFFSITLTQEAAEKQAAATGPLKRDTSSGQCYLSDDIALFLDDVEVDRLRIGCDLQGRATTNIQISGSGSGRVQQEAVENTLQEMKKLQTVIMTGSLPIKLDVVKMDRVSPTLGKEFLDNILLVGLLVVLSVVSVVFLRYRKLKIVLPMVVTLLSEIVLILGFAALVRWNLDLASIAGIIIVIGTGVDHLIIITDETVRGADEISWKKRIKNAMFIVVGAYLTTLSGMFPLYWAGAGLLKGFALTTIVGISAGVLLARPAYAAMVKILLED